MSVTVFSRGHIVDPSRGVDEIGSVIVDGRKIVAAGKAALNQGVPEGATVIDCAGKTIIPLCPFAAAQFRRHKEWADVLSQ